MWGNDGAESHRCGWVGDGSWQADPKIRHRRIGSLLSAHSRQGTEEPWVWVGKQAGQYNIQEAENWISPYLDYSKAVMLDAVGKQNCPPSVGASNCCPSQIA